MMGIKKQINEAVGHTIGLARKCRRMDQKTFSESVGLGQGVMSRLESGQQEFTLEKLETIALGLGLRPSDILKGAGY